MEHVHPAYAVPDRAIVLAGAIIVVVTLSGTLKSIVAAASFTILIYCTIANLAALRMPTEKKHYPNWIPALGLASCVVLAASQRPITITTGLLLLGGWFRAADGGASLRRGLAHARSPVTSPFRQEPPPLSAGAPTRSGRAQDQGAAYSV